MMMQNMITGTIRTREDMDPSGQDTRDKEKCAECEIEEAPPIVGIKYRIQKLQEVMSWRQDWQWCEQRMDRYSKLTLREQGEELEKMMEFLLDILRIEGWETHEDNPAIQLPDPGAEYDHRRPLDEILSSAKAAGGEITCTHAAPPVQGNMEEMPPRREGIWTIRTAEDMDRFDRDTRELDREARETDYIWVDDENPRDGFLWDELTESRSEFLERGRATVAGPSPRVLQVSIEVRVRDGCLEKFMVIGVYPPGTDVPGAAGLPETAPMNLAGLLECAEPLEYVEIMERRNRRKGPCDPEPEPQSPDETPRGIAMTWDLNIRIPGSMINWNIRIPKSMITWTIRTHEDVDRFDRDTKETEGRVSRTMYRWAPTEEQERMDIFGPASREQFIKLAHREVSRLSRPGRNRQEFEIWGRDIRFEDGRLDKVSYRPWRQGFSFNPSANEIPEETLAAAAIRVRGTTQEEEENPILVAEVAYPEPGSRMLRAVFEGPSWCWADMPPVPGNARSYRYSDHHPAHLVICPETTCLAEREARDARGIIVRTGEKDRVTGIAAPCWRHQDSFVFTPGWYERFADAMENRDTRSGAPANPLVCPECGESYTAFHWGWGKAACPDCNIPIIERERRLHDLGTHTSELGRRLGLGTDVNFMAGHGALTLDERERELEGLLDFIQAANRAWYQAGGDPNATRDLGAEYERFRSQPTNGTTTRRRDWHDTGWADPYGRGNDDEVEESRYQTSIAL